MITKRKLLCASYLFLLLTFCHGKSITGMFSKKNTSFTIENKIDLKGKTLKIPENCRLIFSENGSIENGTIYFNNTIIEGSPSFISIKPKGTIANKEIYLSWFNFLTDEKLEKDTKKNAELLNNLIQTVNGTIICDSFIPVADSIKIKTQISFKGIRWNEKHLKENCDFYFEPDCGFYCVSETNLFEIRENGSINLYGIKLKGKENCSKTTESTNKTIGIYAGIQDKTNYRSQIGVTYDCSISDFYVGIEVLGSYLERIQNTTFSNCNFGIYSIWTSDFDIFGCRFISCSYANNQAAVFLAASSMVNINGNLFEGNYTDILLRDGDTILNIQENIFKNAGYCNICLCLLQDQPLSMLSKEDLFPTPMDCIVITENQFSAEKSEYIKAALIIKAPDLSSTNLVLSDNNFFGKYERESLALIN
ncbi:MAG: hypothetical protein MJ176_10090 [Treponema sp.]|nr:hypothetical protein [Treponema sp.]